MILTHLVMFSFFDGAGTAAATASIISRRIDLLGNDNRLLDLLGNDGRRATLTGNDNRRLSIVDN